MGLLFPRSGPVAGPSPVLGLFDHLGTNGIKNHIAADFEKMGVLLDKDCLVPALEEVTGLVVTFVPCLSINTV